MFKSIPFSNDSEPFPMSVVKIFLLIVLLTLSSPSYAQEAKVQKISNNVYAVFIQYYHSLVVIGDKGVLITDPANSGRADILKAEIAKLTPLPISHIVLSHEHYDHVGGTDVFPRAEIYAQQCTQSVFPLDELGIVPKKVHHLFVTDATIFMGKTEVELHHYGAGDGVATTIVYLPKEKVVYSADIYEVGSITDGKWLDDSNYVGSRLILNKLVALKPKHAITAHSLSLDPKHLQLGADFYNDLYDAVSPKVREAVKNGFPAVMKVHDELPKEIRLDKFKDFKNYDHLPSHVRRMILSIFHGG